MLSRSSQTSRTSTIPAAGSVHPLQEYISDLHSKSGKDFPDIDEEEGREQGKQKDVQQIPTGGDKGERTNFKELVSNKNFGELFEQFFVVEHKRLVVLRSKILLDRDVNYNTLITPTDVNAHKVQALREHLHHLQTVIFKNPKGQKYDDFR